MSVLSLTGLIILSGINKWSLFEYIKEGTGNEGTLLPLFLKMAAGFLPGAFLLLLSRFHDGLGEGDGIVNLALGGIIGLPDCLFSLTAGFLSAAAAGLVLMAVVHKKRTDSIPFIPFELIGFLVLLCIRYNGVFCWV